PTEQVVEHAGIAGKMGVGGWRLRRSARVDKSDRDVQAKAEVNGGRMVGQNDLRLRRRLVHERLADQVGANVGLEGLSVKDMLDAVGLDSPGQAELQRPAPGIGHQVAAQIARAIADYREEAQVGGGSRLARRGR